MEKIVKGGRLMPRSSTKQSEILSFLTRFIAETGYPPTVREIAAAVGLSSTASVHYHLDALRRAGLIEMDSSKNRAISLPSHETPAEPVARIPIIGVVTAGLPILAVENIEGYLPWDGGTDCFALRVRGDSMTGAGILSGDVVVVRPQATADTGDIVVALLDDEATVKRLRRGRGEVWLMPENPAYSPIDGREAVILGKVKAVFREY